MSDSASNGKRARIFYARVDEFARREEKYRFLDDAGSVGGVQWQELVPDAKHTWLTEGMREEFEGFLPVGTKEAKLSNTIRDADEAIFKLYSNGVSTNRNEWVYAFDKSALAEKIKSLISNYNSEVARYSLEKQKLEKKEKENPAGEREKINIDEFVNSDPTFVKWTDRLKEALTKQKFLEYDSNKIRSAIFRPFTRMYLYFDSLLVHRRYQQHLIFPTPATESQNKSIWIKVGSEVPMFALMVKVIPDLLPQGGSQCFSFYSYNEDGTNRRENITDWALAQFRAQYKDDSISKLDIFHYVYALLHHPTYRERYAANLRRELPRIPYAPPQLPCLRRSGRASRGTARQLRIAARIPAPPRRER